MLVVRGLVLALTPLMAAMAKKAAMKKKMAAMAEMKKTTKKQTMENNTGKKNEKGRFGVHKGYVLVTTRLDRMQFRHIFIKNDVAWAKGGDKWYRWTEKKGWVVSKGKW